MEPKISFGNPVNISFEKICILKDAHLKVENGKRYALVGKNGIGKTTLLDYIARSSCCDMIYVKQEECETDCNVIDTLMSSNNELFMKHKRFTQLESMMNDNITDDIELDLVEEFNELSEDISGSYIKELVRAQKILLGLGFTLSDQIEFVTKYSGGWRMRIFLAKALFMTPTLLLLDEPSNHLDLQANIWLSEYLKSYNKTIVLVSHDRYLINEVCTTVIHIDNKKLNYYNGDYDMFEKQLLLVQNKIEKDWKLFEKQVKLMRKHGTSKENVAKFIKENSPQKPERNYQVKITLMQPIPIRERYIMMENATGAYEPDKLILEDISLHVEQGDRIAIVGKNGTGKSTLFKLLNGDLNPIKGNITRARNLKIGYYDQHFQDTMPSDVSPIKYLMNLNLSLDEQNAHKYLGMFGLDSSHHGIMIGSLSGGQKARVKLSSFGVTRPHLLLLDEPSNHLDMTTVDSLINALSLFTGAIIVITHNFDLLTKLKSEVWVVEDKRIFKYRGNYEDYVQAIYNAYL